MADKRIAGKLTINNDGIPLELDVLSGILDRSYSAFNFNSGSRENIDGYNLTIDVSDMSKNALRNMEEITHNIDKIFQVTLNLDGQNKQGKAKIAESLGFSGVTLDLELHN